MLSSTTICVKRSVPTAACARGSKREMRPPTGFGVHRSAAQRAARAVAEFG